MDANQKSSVSDDMSTALVNKDQLVNNVMTVLPIELTNTTGTYLQDLNEDCLLEIFSRNSLTLMDLCSLAGTCKRFKQITQRLFPKGFIIEPRRSIRCEIIYTFSSKDHNELVCTIQDIERILRHFGPHLSELYLMGDLALVHLIARYCGDITLKRLEIFYIQGIEGVAQQLNSIFRRLPQLVVHRMCNLPILSDMNFESLIELKIVRSTTGSALLRNTFPILERFGFYFAFFNNTPSEKDDIEALVEFVKRHGCLKIIEIGGVPYGICKLLHAISCSCNELVKLALGNLRCASVDISHLQNLAKLDILRIGFGEEQFEQCEQHQCEHIDISQAFKSLKMVEISLYDERHEVPCQFFDVLSQLQELRELRLVHCNLKDIPWTRLTQLRKVYLSGLATLWYGSDLMNIIEQLINLQELTYEWSLLSRSFNDSPLTEKEFSEIIKIVERRAHVLTLVCHYDFTHEEDNCNEKRKVNLIKLPYYRFIY